MQIIIPYGSNTLPIKKLKPEESLLFQSQTTGSATTLSSIQSMLNFLLNGRCSLIFTTLLMHTTTPNSSLYFSQFSPPYSTLTFPLALPSSIPQQLFAFLFLRTTILTIYTKNIFPTNSGCIKGPGSLGVLQELTLF